MAKKACDMSRNDRAKRAANEALQPGDMWADRPAWMDVVRDCRRRMAAKGVARPAGLPETGELWLHHYMIAATGLVKWTVWYRWDRKRSGVKIGFFVTDCLPDEKRQQAMTKVMTHGAVVVVNQKKNGELARPVRVLVDADGLPVPVPPEVWNAMGL
jgi:hypothetical protein